MFADDAAVESIAFSDPAFLDRFGGGGIHISMSTIAPQTVRDLSKHHAKNGVTYLVSPVIGSSGSRRSRNFVHFISRRRQCETDSRAVVKNLGQRIFDFGLSIKALRKWRTGGSFQTTENCCFVGSCHVRDTCVCIESCNIYGTKPVFDR